MKPRRAALRGNSLRRAAMWLTLAPLFTASLAASLAACGLLHADESVALVTGLGPFPEAGDCYTNYVVGRLDADPVSGTTFTSEGLHAVPVMWQPGFTGRRTGAEVSILDPQGVVVAVTGRGYKLGGGVWAAEVTPTKENHYANSGPSFVLACGSITQQ